MTNPMHYQPMPAAPTLEGPTYEATLEAGKADQFLGLATRRVLYVAGLAALVVAPVLGVTLPEYATALTTAGNLLGSVAIGTALANPTR